MESGELTTSAMECMHVIVVRTSTVNIDVCSTSIVVLFAGDVVTSSASFASSTASAASAAAAAASAAAAGGAAVVVVTVVVEELRGVTKMGCMPQINGTITALTHMAKG